MPSGCFTSVLSLSNDAPGERRTYFRLWYTSPCQGCQVADPPRMIANKEEIMILFLPRGYLSVKNVHGKSSDVVSDNLMLHFVPFSRHDEKMKKERREKFLDRNLLVTFESVPKKWCFLKPSNLNCTKTYIGLVRKNVEGTLHLFSRFVDIINSFTDTNFGVIACQT